jgi:hypothetical protein
MINSKPYTYVLSWTNQDRHYYGVRFAAGCNPSDLGNPYLSSSIHVKRLIEEIGLPDVLAIRKVFSSTEAARLWESKVLRRIGAVRSCRWLNKTDNVSISAEAARHGWSEKSRAKASESHKGKVGANRGRTFSDETRLKMKLSALTRRPRSEESRKLLSEKQKAVGGYGPKFHSAETKIKMSISHRRAT